MITAHRLFVGTIGEGLWLSLDGGATFTRCADGLFVECHVRALAVHPRDPRVLYLGVEDGLFRSDDAGERWTRVASPLDGLQVWSILLLPADPDVILVGTCPARVFRSGDGGRSWSEAGVHMRLDCPRIMHTRVTTLCAPPNDAQTVWAGVEIDGVYRSRDGGRSWRQAGTGLSSVDIHALAYIPASKRLVATTNNDVNQSYDDGDTWTPLHMRDTFPMPYYRGLTQQPGRPETLWLGTGDAPPGTTGLVARSLDSGASWQPAAMPGRANSTIWTFAAAPAAPDFVYAASVSGQLYRSTDGGASWQRLARDFGEVRALAWTGL